MLENRVCLITGSNAGIGYAITEACLANGALVMIHGLDASEVEAARAGLGDRAAATTGDLSDPATPERLVNACLERFGRSGRPGQQCGHDRPLDDRGPDPGAFRPDDGGQYPGAAAPHPEGAAASGKWRSRRHHCQYRVDQRLLRRAQPFGLFSDKGGTDDRNAEPGRCARAYHFYSEPL